MNMTIKELQTTCDDLYYQFVCRLSHVTDFETVDKGDCNTVCLYTDKNHDDCISITKWNDGDIWFWADDFNGLLIGDAGEGYGRETVNPALRYLFSQLPSIKRFFEINHYDKSIDFFDYDYETILNKIGFMILDHFEKRPELFALTNFNDMLNFAVDSDREYDYE